jgi:hypothetical protein
MKIQEVCVRNEEIAAMQYFVAKKDEKSGDIKVPAYFDVILKSGVTMHILGDDGFYAKVVEQVGIQ